jgi:hypothetical protein
MCGTCQAGFFLNANEKRGTQSGVSILAPTMTFCASFMEMGEAVTEHGIEIGSKMSVFQ